MQHEAMVTDEADSSDGRAGTNEECAWRGGLNEERPTTGSGSGQGYPAIHDNVGCETPLELEGK